MQDVYSLIAKHEERQLFALESESFAFMLTFGKNASHFVFKLSTCQTYVKA